MRIIHLLRKCNPGEWGGTETAVQRLVEGLHQLDVDSVVYCPRCNNGHTDGPLMNAGWSIRRFHACVPIWGIPAKQKRQLISIGGNLMSFDLFWSLLRERAVSLIHTHTLGRLGAIALEVSRRRRLPFVISIHGGYLDLPDALKQNMGRVAVGGIEWGKLFSLLLRTRRFFADADAIVTCNENEAAGLRAQYPGKPVQVQPHGVPLALYRPRHSAKAHNAFPQIAGKQLLLCVGRIDPVKNQRWLIQQAPAIFQRHPLAVLLLAGAGTDEAYSAALKQDLRKLGLEQRVLLTGGLPPGDPRLIGLLQIARAVILPSVSETFGLVILESWAAGTVPISSRTSGASALIRHGKNGWLFDLDNRWTFHQAIDHALLQPDWSSELAAAGNQLVHEQYDTVNLASRMQTLYKRLVEAKQAQRHRP